MAKYQPQELKSMAQQALDAKLYGDDRYMMLVMTLCVAAGMNVADVEYRINQLAETGHCDN